METKKETLTPEQFAAELMKAASERFISIELFNNETSESGIRIKMYFDGRWESNAPIGHTGNLFGMVHSFAVARYKELYIEYENMKKENESC